MAVVIAFLANIAIAIAKTVVALISGSASLLAEAIHSWADAGNEVFLLIADRKGERPRDRTHPVGYGRDAYVWSLFAAVGVFTVGAVLSVVTGVQELLDVLAPGQDVAVEGLNDIADADEEVPLRRHRGRTRDGRADIDERHDVARAGLGDDRLKAGQGTHMKRRHDLCPDSGRN